MRSLGFLLFSLILAFSLSAQTTYKNIRIGKGKGYYAPEEPCYAIHPTQPEVHVVGTNIRNIYVSGNAGKSWKAVEVSSPHGVFGDPCLVADSAGRFYFFHLSDPTGKQWASDQALDRIVCQSSDDNGQSWTGGSFTGLNGTKDQDKEWSAIDPQTGVIYLTWTQFDAYASKAPGDSTHILFSKSSDRGNTWSQPIRLNQLGGNCLDDGGTAEGAVPAVGPKGELYVAWALNEKIWMNRSLDGGVTWMPVKSAIADQPGGWKFDVPGLMRCNGLPITACDRSRGTHRGTVYVNWSDQRNGTEDTDIFLAYSSDKGSTWSDPVRVNNDAAGKQQFFTWMSVDQSTGAIYIIYYDRRNYTGLETEVWMATSTDGGRSFTNERISKRPFVPNDNTFLGDYNHIIAQNGMIRPVWTRIDGKKLSVWTALIQK